MVPATWMKRRLRIAGELGQPERILQPKLRAEPAEAVEILHGGGIVGIGGGGIHHAKNFERTSPRKCVTANWPNGDNVARTRVNGFDRFF